MISPLIAVVTNAPTLGILSAKRDGYPRLPDTPVHPN
jgi:hypothetical protein